MDEADIVVISYGCTARSARRAVREARREGIQAGLLRLISLWPFPEEQVRALANSAKTLVVAEMNLGQMRREVERYTGMPVCGVHHAGGRMIAPGTILEAIREANA